MSFNINSIKVSVFLFLIIFTGQQATALDFKFGLMSGVGSYSNKELKKFQDMQYGIRKQFFKDLKKVAEFPGYFNHQGFVELNLGRSSVGADFSYYSTGANNSVADYSGLYRMNMNLRGYRYSGNYKYYFVADNTPDNAIKLYSQLNLGIVRSYLDIVDEFEIYDYFKTSDDLQFTNGSMFYELGLGSELALNRYLSIVVSTSFEKVLQRDFNSTSRRDVKLSQYHNNIKTGADWSGFRLRIGFALALGKS